MGSYDRRQVRDLSSFFLVEFSDDSEADLNVNIAANLVEVNQEDNIDAQSCCNDMSGYVSNPDNDEFELRTYGHDFQEYGSVERPWEEDEDEEEGVVNMSVNRRVSDSKMCIQGRGRYQQPLNEVERNKIFWDTCLASGY